MSNTPPAYLDFDLLIDRAEQGYLARVIESPAGNATQQLQPPFPTPAIEQFSLRLSEHFQRKGSVAPVTFEDIKHFGNHLFERVFQGEVLACLRTSINKAEDSQTSLRLRLRLTGVPELAELPWEYLFDQVLNRFVALSTQTPVVRYLELPSRTRPLNVEGPLRVLVVMASPRDQAPLKVKREWKQLSEAVAPLEAAGLIALELLEPPTIWALINRLRQHTYNQRPYHILQFIGHGAFDTEQQKGMLLFEDTEGLTYHVRAHQLSTILHDHRWLRLVVLNACEGGRISRTNAFAGVAQHLIQQRVPAVVAMQFAVSDRAATRLTCEFYRALSDGAPVDAALTEARKLLYAGDDSLEWGTPVLYMSLRDGKLFERPPVQSRIAQPEENVNFSRAITLLTPDSVQQLQFERTLHHSKGVRSVAFAADGKALAAGSAVDKVRLWNSENGALLRTLEGHSGAIDAVAFSADGQWLASASWDSTVRLWHAADGECVHTLRSHQRYVCGVAVAPDGQTVASASADQTVKLWRTANGELIHTLKDHGDWVCGVAFAPDGQTVASASQDKTLRLWQTSNGKLLHTLSGHQYWVRSVAFAPDGQTLASASEDKTVRLWRTTDGAPLRTLTDHRSEVLWVAFAPGGHILASASADAVLFWNSTDGRLIHRLSEAQPSIKMNGIKSIAFSPDGRRLAVGCNDSSIHIWCLE